MLVYDDETADVVTIETGIDTVVQRCGDTDCTIPGATPTATPCGLTKQPTGERATVAILTDGLVDVVSIGGVAMDPAELRR